MRLILMVKTGQEVWMQLFFGFIFVIFESPTCTLMAPDACKIPRYNVLQVPIQIIPLGVPKRDSFPVRVGSKL